jgi:hypothetical protein
MLPPFLMIYERDSILILVWLAKDAGYLVSESNPPVQTAPSALNQNVICHSKNFFLEATSLCWFWCIMLFGFVWNQRQPLNMYWQSPCHLPLRMPQHDNLFSAKGHVDVDAAFVTKLTLMVFSCTHQPKLTNSMPALQHVWIRKLL